VSLLRPPQGAAVVVAARSAVQRRALLAGPSTPSPAN